MATITEDYRIDALLAGLDYRWNAADEPGTAVKVRYSFMTKVPSYADTEDGHQFTVFTSSQKTAAREIFAYLESQFLIDFEEVSDTSGSPDIRLGNNFQTDSAGYAFYPEPSGDEQGGDVYINNDPTAYMTTDVVAGTFAYSTLLHEIGHALGLRHPGDYNAGSSESEDDPPYLTGEEDAEAYSIMSYTGHPQFLERIDLGPYDIEALGFLYGYKIQNAGDTTFVLDDSMGHYVQTLIDDGGIDLLDASACTEAVVLDLNPASPGHFSSVGLTPEGELATDNLSISLTTVIEEATGGSGDDILIANAADNILSGGAGSDLLIGLWGYDSLIGGSGEDYFGISGLGHYYLQDFSVMEDVLVFDKDIGVNNLGELAPYITSIHDSHEGAVVEFINNVASITFVGIPVSQLSADFVLFEFI